MNSSVKVVGYVASTARKQFCSSPMSAMRKDTVLPKSNIQKIAWAANCVK